MSDLDVISAELLSDAENEPYVEEHKAKIARVVIHGKEYELQLVFTRCEDDFI